MSLIDEDGVKCIELSVFKNKVMNSFVIDLCVDSLCSMYHVVTSGIEKSQFCAYFSTLSRLRGVELNDCEFCIKAEHIESTLPLLLHFLDLW